MVHCAEAVKVLFVSGIDGDTRRYRCFHQQEQLALKGMVTGFREGNDPALLVDALEYEVYVLHRVPCTRLIGAVIDVAHLRGRPVVFETDDLVFIPEFFDDIGYVDSLSPEDARQFHRDLHLQTETFRRCDCVLTSTEFLAQAARDRGKPAYVNRNAPSGEMIAVSEEAFAARWQLMKDVGHNDGPLVLGYFSGTRSHNRDFQVINEPLLWVLETYPEVWLHIGGHLDLDPSFAPYRDRIRRAPYVDWRELPHLIARVDINLAPLEYDNPFCQAKSENKFVEAALVGVPTIASRVGAFDFTITHGQDGLLASTADEWRSALSTLVESRRRRREMGESARCTALSRYTPGARASELARTVRAVVHRHGGPGAPPDHILCEWADTMKSYAAGMEEEILTSHNQIRALRRTLQEYEHQLVSTVRRKQEAIEQCRQAMEAQKDLIVQRDRTIEEIMQGRVMRAITSGERWIRRMTGKSERDSL